MGSNDTRDQLEAALEENVRLEADNARLEARLARTEQPKTTYHTLRAEQCLELRHRIPGTDPTLDLAEAQVHATLALAAEQRIANLISVYTAENADAFNLMPAEAAGVFYPMFGEILGRIREELKLV